MRELFKKALRYIYWHLPLSDKAKFSLRSKILDAISLPQNLYQSIVTPKFKAPFNLPLKNPNLPDIFILATIDWDFRIQRPQQLAKKLAQRGHRVFYCSNVFQRKSGPGFQVKKLDEQTSIYIINLFWKKPLSIYDHVPTKLEFAQLKKDFAFLLTWTQYSEIVTIVDHPFWTPVACALPNNTLIYDCMDLHEGFGNENTRWPLKDQEIFLLKKADLILASSQLLYDKARQFNATVSLIRNATDFSYFGTRPPAIYKDSQNRKIIGYYGAIADWFDTALIAFLAEKHPLHLILLIGDDTANVKQALNRFDNILFLGEIHYDLLSFYLYSFDVCIIPFKINALTKATNPVKVYEYLSAGKPVVSTCLPEVEMLSQYVSIAHSPEAFSQKVYDCLTNPGDASLRQTFAKTQSWNERLDVIEKTRSLIPQPKVSIVVLTYNHISLLKACIESIQKYTQYSNYEVIIVDNGSTDETHDYFKTLPPDYKIILNDANLGYARGNNAGIKQAKGDYIILLNNDTEVTPGWLTTLVNHFKHNENIGLLGPVTNNIGNEAKIHTKYSSPSNRFPEVQKITADAMGELWTLNTLAFFCVMVPRNVVEEIGLLDEQFGLGFFEDDDYCRRVEAAGYKIMCARDVFVHHHLSATYSQMGTKARQELFEKNKLLYEKKWGHWKPHQYSTKKRPLNV